MTIPSGSLCDHGERHLRGVAVDIASAGLQAADPARAVTQVVRRHAAKLTVGNRDYDLRDYKAVWVVAAGKASGPLAQQVESILGNWLSGGLVVLRAGSAVPLHTLTILEAEHPLPGKGSERAGLALLDLADQVGPRDLVVSLITGGSSSLATAPIGNITSAEKRQLHELLLTSGADIEQTNTVRKHTSTIKGGRLAARMSPAAIINLTVSDVAGDNPEYICDLTIQNTGRAADAIAVLERYDLLDKVPTSVRLVLESNPTAELPTLDHIDISTHLLVTGQAVAQAMVDAAEHMGRTAIILGTELNGSAEGTGSVLACLARESSRRGRPFSPSVVLIACGGESTVTLSDGALFGSGGPNLETGVAAALQLRDVNKIALLSIDTDGSDGGTAAAGALVDGTTFQRATAVGVDLREALAKHETFDALNSVDDLIITGPTHTNVNDMIVIVVGAEPSV